MSILSETATAEIRAILRESLEQAQASPTVPDDPDEEACDCHAGSATAILDRLATDTALDTSKPHGDDTYCDHPVRSAFNAIIFDVCQTGWRIVNAPTNQADTPTTGSTNPVRREGPTRNVKSH